MPHLFIFFFFLRGPPTSKVISRLYPWIQNTKLSRSFLWCFSPPFRSASFSNWRLYFMILFIFYFGVLHPRRFRVYFIHFRFVFKNQLDFNCGSETGWVTPQCLYLLWCVGLTTLAQIINRESQLALVCWGTEPGGSSVTVLGSRPLLTLHNHNLLRLTPMEEAIHLNTLTCSSTSPGTPIPSQAHNIFVDSYFRDQEMP